MLCVHRIAHFEETVKCNAVQLLLHAADRDGDSLLTDFLVTQNDDVRYLAQAVLLDFLIHIFVAVIHIHTDSHVQELVIDPLCIGIVLLADRNDTDLCRRKPERERSLIVLDQDTDKALQGSEDSAVDNDRLLLQTVAVTIGQTEVMRQLEIELDSSALPLAAESVLDLEVDLRSIEGTVAFIDFIISLAVLIVEASLQRCFGAVPYVDIAHEIIRTG